MASRRGDEPREEIVYQAVVICDSYNSRFGPLTRSRSKALLPLASVPLLDYTLSFLVNARIDEVIVYTSQHSNQVKKYLENSGWMQNTSGQNCKVSVIVNEECTSIGDALRDLDAKNLIRSDFVLVNAGTVSNMDLKSTILKHKEKRRVDKGTKMTLVMKQAHPQHRVRLTEDNVVVCTKKATDQLLHYQHVSGCKVEVPLQIFQEHKGTVHLRYDLLDTHISICSPDVPQLYTDNFDYLTRHDFIKGIFVDEEILGNTIYVHVLRDEYAASITSLYMYDCISRDVIGRWSFPYFPGSNLLVGCRSSSSNCQLPCYSYGKYHVYLANVKLDGQPTLKQNVVIASGSCVGDRSVIVDSVIGQNCKIGSNVEIRGAYLWDNVTVGNGCKIKDSLLCDGVVVGESSRVVSGCLIESNVVIGTHGNVSGKFLIKGKQQLPSGARLVECSPDIVGAGVGIVYSYERDEGDADEESIGESGLPDVFGLAARYDDDGHFLADADEYNSESDGDFGDGLSQDDDESLPDDGKVFYTELLDTIKRAEEETIHPDNLILEINSLKHAYNIQIKEVNQLLIQAFLEFPQQDDFAMPHNLLITSLKTLLRKWLAVLKNYYRNVESQLDCLTGVEDVCATHDNVFRTLPQLLMFLYQEDVLDEDVISTWYKQKPETERVRSQSSKFVQWLKQAEEESE